MKKLFMIVLAIFSAFLYVGYGAYEAFYGIKLGETHTPEEICLTLLSKGIRGQIFENEDSTKSIGARGEFKINKDIYDEIYFSLDVDERVYGIIFKKTFTYTEALKNLKDNPDGSEITNNAIYARMRKMANERFERINAAFNFLSYQLIKKSSNEITYRTKDNDIIMRVIRESEEDGEEIFLLYKLNK